MMENFIGHIKENWRFLLFVIVGIIVAVTSFLFGAGSGFGQRSMLAPPIVSNDPDWFMATATRIEPIQYEIARVIEVLDGDTFKADLAQNGRIVSRGVKIRLAGVNSPERFDQNCWQEAKDFTGKWFVGNDKTFVQTWGSDVYGNRPVGFVYKTLPYRSLEQELVKNGYALPCLGYLKGKVSKEKFESHKKVIFSAADYARKNVKLNKASVWSAKPIQISLEVSPNTGKNRLVSGDKITIALTDKSKTVDLSGFSIMDESSVPEHRFYLPKLELNSSNQTVVVNTGVNAGVGWISPNGSQIYAFSDSDWINDDGDTVYLRDSSRKIVAYVVWKY
jgi:endonuclease YncB( thermonuclease family)